MYLQFDVHANDNPVKYDDLSKYSLLFSNKQLESEIEASRSLIQSDKEQHHIPQGKESVQEKVCLYPFHFSLAALILKKLTLTIVI